MINCAQIQAAVAHHYGIPVGTMTGSTKVRGYTGPRQVAMALCRQLVECKANACGRISLTKIGYRFGNRDHSTIWFAIKAIDERRKTDPALRKSMRHLTIELLRGQE